MLDSDVPKKKICLFVYIWYFQHLREGKTGLIFIGLFWGSGFLRTDM